MAVNRRLLLKERRYVIWAVLLGIVVLLNLPVPVSNSVKGSWRDNFSPFQNVMSVLAGKVRESVLFLGDAKQALGEKEQMLEELVRLREKVRNMEEIAKENAELRKHLGFARKSTRKLILCEVTGRGDTSGWWQTVRLNKGRKSGVEPGLAVISVEGLLGKTAEVSNDTCDVLLITDPTCRVACRFSRTGALGIVRGGGVPPTGNAGLEMVSLVRPCRMEYVGREHEIWVNDEVVTSGLGGVFPEGLLLGYVKKTGVDSSGLYRNAEIVPAARMSALEYVFVVTEEAAEKEAEGGE
jgi:rod shape-determining protein MreC